MGTSLKHIISYLRIWNYGNCWRSAFFVLLKSPISIFCVSLILENWILNGWRFESWSFGMLIYKFENWHIDNFENWKMIICNSPATLNIPTPTLAPDHLFGGHNVFCSALFVQALQRLIERPTAPTLDRQDVWLSIASCWPGTAT